MKRRSRFAITIVTMAWFGLTDVHPISAEENKAPTSSTKVSSLNLQQYQGKVVYLDFWASWCGPCRKSFPWMNEMQQRYGKAGLQIVAVNLDQDPKLARQFLEEVPAQFSIAYDPEGISAQTYKVQGMPSSFLIDRQGKLHSTHIGFREKDTGELENTIKNLLKQP